MEGLIDRIQIGVAGLLLGMVIGTKLTPSDALYLWLIVGIVTNTLISILRTYRRIA
jgi:hypothetical protein